MGLLKTTQSLTGREKREERGWRKRCSKTPRTVAALWWEDSSFSQVEGNRFVSGSQRDKKRAGKREIRLDGLGEDRFSEY